MRRPWAFVMAALAVTGTVAFACGDPLPAARSDATDRARDGSVDALRPDGDGASDVDDVPPTPPEDAPIVIITDDGGGPDVAAIVEAGTGCAAGELKARIAPASVDAKSNASFASVGAVNFRSAIDEEGADDGDGSYITCVDDNGNGEWIRFMRDPAGLPSGAAVKSFTVFARASRSPGTLAAKIAVMAYDEDVNHAWGSSVKPLVGTGYETFASTFASPPNPDAGPWTPTLVDKYQLYFRFEVRGEVRLTQIWGEVCYAQ